MRYFVLIVGVIFAMSIWGCDGMQHMDAMLQDPVPAEERVARAQDEQLAKALIDTIAELENELGDESGWLLPYMEISIEQVSDEYLKQIIKDLSNKAADLKITLENRKNRNSDPINPDPIAPAKERREDPDTGKDPIPEPIIHPEGLAIGDRVITENTISDDGGLRGVRIRDSAAIRDDNHRDRWLFDGAIGTVIDGPIEADGYTWWKIHWDAKQGKDKIICHDENPCIGWSVEIFDNSVILKER